MSIVLLLIVRMFNLCLKKLHYPNDPHSILMAKVKLHFVFIAINVGVLKDTKELETLCDLVLED